MGYDVFFRAHPIFTRDEFADHLAASRKLGPRTTESILNYYRKTQRILPIRRGLYATIPRGADPATFPIDLFLVAAKLTRDAFLSHHTALAFHGRAYSIYNHFTYTAKRPLPPLHYRSHVFCGIQSPKALQLAEKEDTGVVQTDRSGIMIGVTTLERTLVDVLHRPASTGSWEEIWQSLESIEFIDIEQILEYALLLENASTAAKVGFFLEQHRDALMIDDSHLDPLRAQRPRQPHYLDRRQSGHLVATWNLIVPKEILERSWAEVL